MGTSTSLLGFVLQGRGSEPGLPPIAVREPPAPGRRSSPRPPSAPAPRSLRRDSETSGDRGRFILPGMGIDNLTSGLIGAIIGSFLGVGGAFEIQWWQNRRDDQAAVRTVHLEVATHTPGIKVAISEGVYVPLSRSAWIGSRLRLAHQLQAVEFIAVARYFANVEWMQGQGFPTLGGGVGSVKDAAEGLKSRD
jgi:hypothetical protein